MILIFIADRQKFAEQLQRVSMVRPVGSSRMNNMSLEQLYVRRRKAQCFEYVIDENNGPVFDFMDAS
jgi:hypothetical protein